MKNFKQLTLILIPLLMILSIGGTLQVLAVENAVNQFQSFDQRRPTTGMMPGSPRHGNQLPDGMEMNNSMLENRSEIRNRFSYFMINAAGKIPFYRWNGLNNFSTYMIKIMRIIEYNDTNNDEQFQPNETVFHIQLQGNADWTFTREAANETTVVFSFFTTNIRLPGFENTILNFTNYLNREAKNLKFDIEIINWPWASENDRIAFQFSFLSHFNDGKNRMMERLNRTNQNPLNRTNEEGLFLRNNDGKIAGFFSSSVNAYASSEDGTIDVKTQVEFQRQLKSADIYLNYPYFGDYLFHDPNVGIGDEVLETVASTISQLVKLLISRPGLFFITTFIGLFAVGVFLIKRRNL